MAELKIMNFGPIKNGLPTNSGFIHFSPITVFCGNQATGKSTIAKLYSTFTWLEKALICKDYKEKTMLTKTFFCDLLKNQRISEYLSEESCIEYRGLGYSFKYENDSFSFDKKGSSKDYIRPKIMYQPAERSLLTTIENADGIQNLPTMLSILSDEYSKALKKLAQKEYIMPISGIKIRYSGKTGKTNVILGGKKIDIVSSSSGIQSSIPISIISDFLSEEVISNISNNIQKLSKKERDEIIDTIKNDYKNDKKVEKSLIDEFEKFFYTGLIGTISDTNKTFILAILNKFFNQYLINVVEEPEQNLFPDSQSNIVYKLVEYNNRQEKNELIITTHSPYVIFYLILCAKAYEVSKGNVPKQEIEKIVPLKSLVSGEKISVYQTFEDGSIKYLEPVLGLPSDSNLLNSALEKQNESFEQLLELEDKYC